jgi:hypothetical protein
MLNQVQKLSKVQKKVLNLKSIVHIMIESCFFKYVWQFTFVHLVPLLLIYVLCSCKILTICWNLKFWLATWHFLGFGCKCNSNLPMLTFCLNCFILYVLQCGGDLDIHCLYTLHLHKSWMFAWSQKTQFDNQYSWLFICRMCKLSTLLHCGCGMHKFWLTFANV